MESPRSDCEIVQLAISGDYNTISRGSANGWTVSQMYSLYRQPAGQRGRSSHKDAGLRMRQFGQDRLLSNLLETYALVIFTTTKNVASNNSATLELYKGLDG
jgi:hypothetical protein